MTEQDTRARAFRDAWSRFATGVTVITTVEPDGSVHGMTANAVTSVSLDPPLMLACIDHARNTHPLVVSTGRFGLSVLSTDQRAVAMYFTKAPEERPSEDAPEYIVVGESPVIAGAIAAMDCKVVEAHHQGDHTVFIAQVEAHLYDHGEPLLWFGGRFGHFRQHET